MKWEFHDVCKNTFRQSEINNHEIDNQNLLLLSFKIRFEKASLLNTTKTTMMMTMIVDSAVVVVTM